ncbi:hypothetical protein PF005_g32426 [Phytophthora fragariae]|uniref:Uncharacterized protein n=2 Tax=Phytophthora TaxID=4783 RepID=A0A6A3V0F7_9STRA|nr:hypothetical protein PF003_g7416 [Phytophthora fragariae]KAE8958312.1 hypothetical protein PR001_g31095 [Phytophthora rubi]KAE8917288.1 hypothetical protein PF009_g32389 [Phytophthora fragariae]KAE8955347.1 hypothetical protein PF011_g31827 [Phytophthora fragariae]KAE8967000.1 hypothetical protein PR002_g28201 [Phytophthora rubi]
MLSILAFYLEAGKKAGLEINFPGDEMHPMQSGSMTADLSAHAISRCEMLTPEDLKAMAAHKPGPLAHAGSKVESTTIKGIE